MIGYIHIELSLFSPAGTPTDETLAGAAIRTPTGRGREKTLQQKSNPSLLQGEKLPVRVYTGSFIWLIRVAGSSGLQQSSSTFVSRLVTSQREAKKTEMHKGKRTETGGKHAC